MSPPPGSVLPACIVGRSTGVGLDRDAKLISDLLEEKGLPSVWKHPRSLSLLQRLPFPRAPKYSLLIFLERVFPAWRRTAGKTILIPNQERFPERHLDRLTAVDSVFCKTHHATEIFSRHHPDVHHLGFTSEDRHLPGVTPDYGRFFHLAGASTMKGTEEILALWRRNPTWPALTLLIKAENAPEEAPANVELISRRLGEDELLELQNSCGIHLCPSRSEGWGHYIAEALSCSAVTITTDGPPMNELVTAERGFLAPHQQSEPRHLGMNYFADPDALEATINTVLATPHENLAQLGAKAREWFLANDQAFRKRFSELIDKVLPSAAPKAPK